MRSPEGGSDHRVLDPWKCIVDGSLLIGNIPDKGSEEARKYQRRDTQVLQGLHDGVKVYYDILS